LIEGRRGDQLELTVIDPGTGLEVGSATIEMDGSEPDFDSLDSALSEVEGHIGFIGQAREPDPEPEPEPTRRRERRNRQTQTDPAPQNLVSRADTPDATWVRVSAGMAATQRDYSLVSQVDPNDRLAYTSGFRPGIEAALELFPVALFAPGVVDGLGLRLRVARFVFDTTVVNTNDTAVALPTRQRELNLELLYTHRIGMVSFGGSLGYESISFSLGANDFYQSSEYSGFLARLGARVFLLDDMLSIGAEGLLRPAPSLSPAEEYAFGAGSSFGFGAGGDVTLTLFDHFEVVGFYAIRQFSTSFDGNGESDIDGAAESDDTFHHLGLRLGYVN
ncbi:MAG: hypothetical protein KC561_20060, partial [Myxococcales bacterium]|nr:hypothetical protein [Myxococcales bacterium]